jgi:hypothetical protein
MFYYPTPTSALVPSSLTKAKIRAAPRAQKMPELKKRIIKVLLWGCAWRRASAVCARLFTPSPRLKGAYRNLTCTAPQELNGLSEKCFTGAYKRTREWEDVYMEDGDCVGEDDEAALSDQEDTMNDDESVGGEEEGDGDAD